MLKALAVTTTTQAKANQVTIATTPFARLVLLFVAFRHNAQGLFKCY
jgi:hypothetical protein